MLPVYVSSVLGVFVSMFASVSSACYICLQWFSSVLKHFSQVFQTFVSSISSAFRRIVTSVTSECFKRRLYVASPSFLSAASHRCFLLS
jgi:phage-related protein